jgi:hypothetical protein
MFLLQKIKRTSSSSSCFKKNIILFKIKKNPSFQKSDLRMNQNDLTLSRVSELFDELEEESRVFISSVERIQ